MREREKRGVRRLCVLAAALFITALLPAAARAETHTFLNLTQLTPSGGAGTFGPAFPSFPSSIAVSGLSGTVSKATVTLINYHSSSPDDADVVLTGPNGQKVMLMSDACGESNPGMGVSFEAVEENWTFDDAAATFVPNNGPCPTGQTASFKPSNYEDPSLDDLSTGGGPVGPYLNSLSLLAGGSPNGAWNLFSLDDNAACCFGFGISGWALTLEVQPPAAGPAAVAATGQRAAALAKCKGKKTKKARRKCRQKAQALPL
jgi:hypothetical protein